MAVHRTIEARQRAIHTNSYKAVAAQNAKYAEENESEYKKPSDEQVKAECQRRWQFNIDRNQKKDVSGFFEV